jgi:hypothetical protein
MNYGDLIRDAWRITWRHPFLWVLGLLAGGTVSTSFGGGGDGRGVPTTTGDGGPIPGGAMGLEPLTRWAGDHLALLAGAAVVLVIAGLVLLVLSLIAQGGLAGATADFASGRTSSFGRAWQTGLHLFWRYVGLWLLLVATVIVIAVMVAGFVALVIGLTTVVEQDAWVIAPAVFVGLLLIVAGIVSGVVASIVVPFAQRAIVVQDVGPLAALRDGWSVFRSHPGASLLIWLLNVGLTIAVGIAATIVMVLGALVLGLPAAALWAAFELSAPTITYIVLAGIVGLGVFLTVMAIANTFFWSYWTLAYLRLRSASPDETPAER